MKFDISAVEIHLLISDICEYSVNSEKKKTRYLGSFTFRYISLKGKYTSKSIIMIAVTNLPTFIDLVMA